MESPEALPAPLVAPDTSKPTSGPLPVLGGWSGLPVAGRCMEQPWPSPTDPGGPQPGPAESPGPCSLCRLAGVQHTQLQRSRARCTALPQLSFPEAAQPGICLFREATLASCLSEPSELISSGALSQTWHKQDGEWAARAWQGGSRERLDLWQEGWWAMGPVFLQRPAPPGAATAPPRGSASSFPYCDSSCPRQTHRPHWGG